MRCVVLDDYQRAARSCADWSALDGRVDVSVLHEHLTGPIHNRGGGVKSFGMTFS